MLHQALFMAEIVSAAFVLWLGLYVITRDLPWRKTGPRRWMRTPMLAGMALVLLSIYVYGNAMESLATSAAEYLLWQRMTWWVAPLAVLLYLWAAIHLFRHKPDGMLMRLFYLVSGVYGLALAAGIASGLMLDTAGIQPRDNMLQPFYTPMQTPFVYFFRFFVLGVLFFVFLIMLNQYRKTRRNTEENWRIRLLVIGSLAGLVGGMITITPAAQNSLISPKQLGDLLVTFGVVVFAYSVARYNAFEHEQLLQHDFVHSVGTVAVSVALYLTSYILVTTLASYPVSPVALIMLSVLAVVTQTPYNWSGVVLDRILLPRWAIAYRSRLVLMRQESITAPDPTRMLQEAEESFGDLIRTVQRDEIDELVHDEVDHIFQYSRFGNNDVLADSRLQKLETVGEQQAQYATDCHVAVADLSAKQRAESLRLYLVNAIDEWLCNGATVAPSADTDPPAEVIEQVILRKKYAEGMSRTAVERYILDTYEIAVTGGAYSRHLKQARQRLADVIADHELSYAHRQTQAVNS